MTTWEKAENTALGCNTSHAEAACDVTVRYLVQGTRIASRESVFGQFVYGFALAGADSGSSASTWCTPRTIPRRSRTTTIR